ncbi:hypothetical protein FPV67DRAFT_1672200 [Lyophyllum atratum]|nr:hypothetical protein FPV67DRAFT_1672200 [Lyophyllum atratum]
MLACTLLAAATNPTTTVIPPPQPTTTIPAMYVQSSDSSAVAALLDLLGIVIQGVAVPIGITCTPIDVLGIGAGGAGTAQPVCYSNNEFHGVVAVGCTSINIGLRMCPRNQ